QDEATIVESIAQHIHTKLFPKLPPSDEKLVGIASKVEEVIKLADIRVNDVRFIGIWGMGGIGKTTIAHAVYKSMEDNEFKVCCFLEIIRENCKKKGLVVQVQMDLLAQCHIKCKLDNENQGREVIKNALCKKKVLLVLDDASDISQLDNLAGKRGWFGLGSRVIITTRDMHLLKRHAVHATYEVQTLVQEEALRFFCLNSFNQDQPNEGYLEISQEIVEHSGCLPLALKVLGKHFNGSRDIGYWRSELEKLKNGLDLDIGKRFCTKEIFLDIACFFKGERKKRVTDLLVTCRGYNPEADIKVLIERSLVTIVSDKLEMHDLLQEMGRDIVNQSPNDGSQLSRLWSANHINRVLKQNKGVKETESIFIKFCGDGLDVRGRSLVFSSNMCKLKLLILDGVTAHIITNIPTSLEVLRWTECPMESLPLKEDEHYELVEIDLSSKIKHVWHGKKVNLFK
ncbi:hypothetical protein S83_048445, partial [Arachis hypogaea]